jgi:hypothetical protein
VRVNTVKDTTRPRMITYGRLRSVLDALPARMSGNTGSMHGESAVITPATNATPSRTSTIEG